MRGVLRALLCLMAGVLACAAPARGAQPVPAFTVVAQSSLVTLEAARTAAGIELRVRRNPGDVALPVTALAVSIDGHSAPASSSADGAWSVPWPTGAAPAAARLEVVIDHDGIREVLSGLLPGSPAGTAQSARGGAAADGHHDHKQLLWWVLNIAIVLIAVLLISRRMS